MYYIPPMEEIAMNAAPIAHTEYAHVFLNYGFGTNRKFQNGINFRNYGSPEIAMEGRKEAVERNEK